MEKRPNRKSIRLRDYDYRSKGVYHITICTRNKVRLFGSITNGQMTLSEFGRTAKEDIEAIPCHYPDVEIVSYVVMPNHVHLLLAMCANADAMNGVPTAGNTLGQIIGAYKAGVSRKIGQAVWQPRFYEHIIRGEQDYLDTIAYIQKNPAAWEKDDYYFPGNPTRLCPIP